jgi:hypothetical protein
MQRLLRDLTAQVERERQPGAGVQGDLERLAQPSVELAVGPAGEQGYQRRVRGG